MIIQLIALSNLAFSMNVKVIVCCFFSPQVELYSRVYPIPPPADFRERLATHSTVSCDTCLSVCLSNPHMDNISECQCVSFIVKRGKGIVRRMKEKLKVGVFFEFPLRCVVSL